MDLIKTIEEDTEIQDLSEDSDAEVEVIWFFSEKHTKKKIFINLDPCVNSYIMIFSINQRN